MAETSTVRRLLVGHALAAVGMSLPWPLLVLLVWEQGGSDLAVGLTAAARMLPYVALSWATGALADRFRRDRIVRVTLVARAALLVLVAAALTQGWLVVAVLAAATAIGAGTPAYPALAAALPAVAGARRRRATDLLVTIEVASFVVGPAVGALLLFTGSGLPVVGAVMTGAALMLMAGVRLPRPATNYSGDPRPSVGSVFRTARRCPGALAAIGTVALLNGVLAGVGLALLPLSTDVWGGGFGIATAVLGFGALGAPLLGLGDTARRSSAQRSRRGLVLLGLPLILVALSPAVGWTLPLLGLVGAAAVYVEGAATETIQDAVPDSRRAAVLGLTDSAMVGAALVASLVAPALASALGARGLVVLLAASCLVLVVIRGRARTGLSRTVGQARAAHAVTGPPPTGVS